MAQALRVGGTAAFLLVAIQISRADDEMLVSTSNSATSTQSNVNQPSSDDGDGTSWMDDYILGDDQPKWQAYAGAMVLHRSSPSPGQIIHPVGGPTTVSNASDFTFNPGATGPDIMVTRNFGSGGGVQVRYFGSMDWTATHDYGAVGNVQVGSISNFGAIGLTSTYTSRLQNFEINWLRPLSDRFSFVAGFRALELADALQYHVQFPAFSVNYNWSESNKLYGAQLGGIVKLWELDSRFSVNCAFKAGVYGNTANNASNVIPSTGGSFPGGGATVNASFVGDINVYASYRFTKHWAAYGGYQMLWVQSVALASNQAIVATANQSQNGITTSGDVFYNGATFGLAFVW